MEDPGQRQLRADDSVLQPVYPQLPGQQGRTARAGQQHPHCRGEQERRHLRPGLPGNAAQGQRHAVPDTGRGPLVDEVDLDAERALAAGHRGRHHRRRGDAFRLRRQQAGRRPAEIQYRPRWRGRQPGGQRPEVEHDRHAAAGASPKDGRAPKLWRVLPVARDQDPQLRERPGGRAYCWLWQDCR